MRAGSPRGAQRPVELLALSVAKTRRAVLSFDAWGAICLVRRPMSGGTMGSPGVVFPSAGAQTDVSPARRCR
jgi:hypothetical protein